MSSITKEMMERIKNVKTLEEVQEMVKDTIPEKKVELDPDLVSKVTGGVGRVQLNDSQAEHVVGGGHYVTDKNGVQTWVTLIDDGYQLGTDRMLDKAYRLERGLIDGLTQESIIEIASVLFHVHPLIAAWAIMSGGPVNLVDNIRENPNLVNNS